MERKEEEVPLSRSFSHLREYDDRTFKGMLNQYRWDLKLGDERFTNDQHEEMMRSVQERGGTGDRSLQYAMKEYLLLTEEMMGTYPRIDTIDPIEERDKSQSMEELTRGRYPHLPSPQIENYNSHSLRDELEQSHWIGIFPMTDDGLVRMFREYREDLLRRRKKYSIKRHKKVIKIAREILKKRKKKKKGNINSVSSDLEKAATSYLREAVRMWRVG